MSFENMVRVLSGEVEAVATEVEAALVPYVTETRVYVRGSLLMKV